MALLYPKSLQLFNAVIGLALVESPTFIYDRFFIPDAFRLQGVPVVTLVNETLFPYAPVTVKFEIVNAVPLAGLNLIFAPAVAATKFVAVNGSVKITDVGAAVFVTVILPKLAEVMRVEPVAIVWTVVPGK